VEGAEVSDFRISDAPLSRDVRFICTDRGQHPSREIAIVGRDVETGGLHAVGTGQTIGPRVVRREGALTREAGHARWELPRCPSCGRAPRLSSDRMAALVTGVLAQEPGRQQVTFDASALD
jgi:hypothetical protein